MGKMKKDQIGWKGKDSTGRQVVWYKESFDDHMTKHPDVKKILNKLKECIENPTYKQSNKRRKSVDQFSLVRQNMNGVEFYLKVVLDYNGDPIFIRSAYITTNLEDATICS